MVASVMVGLTVLAASCSGEESGTQQDPDSVRDKTEELTATQQRILGFEGTIGGTGADWRALSGVATSNATRVEGAKSMALRQSDTGALRVYSQIFIRAHRRYMRDIQICRSLIAL